MNTLVSKLPRVHGRVLLSASLLRDPGIRICGRLMGQEGLEQNLEALPPEGDSFTLARGPDRYHVPEPYLLVDKLLLDKIHLLADAPLAPNFYAMTSGGDEGQHWLFPFHPCLLRYLDLDELRKPGGGSIVACTRRGGPGQYLIEVTVAIAGWSFIRQYDSAHRNRDMAGNGLDVRIWPNIRFLTSPKLPPVDADRVHYFRIRQQAAWDLDTQVVALQAEGGNEVKVFQAEGNWDPGWPEELEPHAFRLARCYAFPATGGRAAADGTVQAGQWEPVGLSFTGRGVCLFRLHEPRCRTGDEPACWRVGVDLGTSTTCVAKVELGEGELPVPSPIQFEMQTTTLHAFPCYDDVYEADRAYRHTEGAAAVLDFPYNYCNEAMLTDGPDLPTQVVTRLPFGAAPSDGSFLMSNGLILPRSELASSDIVALLRDYPPAPVPDRRPFHLMSDPRWRNRVCQRTFLWHLYKMIVYHAACNGARLAGAAFSFPRAYSKDDVDYYRQEVLGIFGDHGRLDPSAIEIMTASEAVHRWMAIQPSASPRLVFDVGGGTCDILGLFADRRFQASYELAGRYVVWYVVASPRLQRLLLDAIVRVVPLHPAGTPEGQLQRSQRRLLNDLLYTAGSGAASAAQYREQACFQMLGMMGDEHYPGVADALQGLTAEPWREADRKAIMGFFCTLTLLYCGMTYQVGKLMRQEGIKASNVGVILVGNGSRFYRFLENRAISFSRVLQGVFAAACQESPDMRLALEPEGKTLAAKGLLVHLKDRTTVSAQVIPDTASHQYLLTLAGQTSPQPPMGPDFPDLQEFMEVVNRQLPDGTLDGSTVIPYCQGNLAAEMADLYRYIVSGVYGHEVLKAKRLKEDLDQVARLAPINDSAAAPYRDSANAVEPRFIIRLKCLLDQVRERYATME